MTELFNKTREYVKNSFNNNKAQLLHFDRTAYWLQKLKPDADEAFLIAALGHDIERAFRNSPEDLGRIGRGFLDKDDLKIHQEKGAEILGAFLAESGAGAETIKKVKHLISKHEVGGDQDQNLLKDADSLSFLENNAGIFISRIDKLGYGKIKEKFDWMYNRISDPETKKIAKPMYERMIQKLDQYKK